MLTIFERIYLSNNNRNIKGDPQVTLHSCNTGWFKRKLSDGLESQSQVFDFNISFEVNWAQKMAFGMTSVCPLSQVFSTAKYSHQLF